MAVERSLREDGSRSDPEPYRRLDRGIHWDELARIVEDAYLRRGGAAEARGGSPKE
jgi:hypothetical protein